MISGSVLSVFAVAFGVFYFVKLPTADAQFFSSTYENTEPGYVAGAKALAKQIQDYFHAGWGSMKSGVSYMGTF